MSLELVPEISTLPNSGLSIVVYHLAPKRDGNGNFVDVIDDVQPIAIDNCCGLECSFDYLKDHPDRAVYDAFAAKYFGIDDCSKFNTILLKGNIDRVFRARDRIHKELGVVRTRFNPSNSKKQEEVYILQ